MLRLGCTKFLDKNSDKKVISRLISNGFIVNIDRLLSAELLEKMSQILKTRLALQNRPTLFRTLVTRWFIDCTWFPF